MGEKIQAIKEKLIIIINLLNGKQDKLTASDNISITNSIIKTKDSQFVNIDCSGISSYTVQDEKTYVLNNVSTIELSISGASERHFFVICGTTAPTVITPASWGVIPFAANKIVEISILNGKAVFREW